MKYLLLFLFALTANAIETRDRVVIIDSGLTPELQNSNLLCNDKPFLNYTKSPNKDVESFHGSNVFLLASKNVSPYSYCFTIVKIFPLDYSYSYIINEALSTVASLKPKYINMSFGGLTDKYESEEQLIKEMLGKAKITIAAGNNSLDLSNNCNYYPACYFPKFSNIYVVGAESNGIKALYTNYGEPVRYYEDGASYCYGGQCLNGTSFSAPKVLNKLLRGIQIEKKQYFKQAF